MKKRTLSELHAELGPDDTITFPGVDHGNGSKPLRVIARNTHYIAVRVPGHRGWVSIGQSGYFGAHDLVFLIVDTYAHGKSLVLDEVIEICRKVRR